MSSGFHPTIFQYFPDQWGIFRLCTSFVTNTTDSPSSVTSECMLLEHFNICQINKDWSESHEYNSFQSSVTSECILHARRKPNCKEELQPRRSVISWGPDNFHSVHLSPPTVHSWQKRKEDGSVDFHCVHHHLHKPGLVSSWEFQRQCCRPTWTQSRPEAEWGKFSTRYIEEILQYWEENRSSIWTK